MIVNEDSDTIVTKLVDKGLDLVQVVGVIDSGWSFNCFPHNAESHNLGAPFLHVLQVFFGNGHVEIEVISDRQIVWLLYHDIESVEDAWATLLVTERPCIFVNEPSLSGSITDEGQHRGHPSRSEHLEQIEVFYNYNINIKY